MTDSVTVARPDVTVSQGAGWQLRLGDWRSVLADVGEVDALIADPPYGERTHRGHDASASGHLGEGNDGARRRALAYHAWTPVDVRAFVRSWAPRVRGWIGVMSCVDLAASWRDELEAAGRYAFAPLPCVIRGMTCRLSGDGPSSWAIYLTVSRPRSREWSTWGTLPGAYTVGRGSERRHIGGKPIELMRAIVRDYSRPGDLIADPCAGYGTTGRAALIEGRRFIGAEIDPATYSEASRALAMPVARDLFAGVGA